MAKQKNTKAASPSPLPPSSAESTVPVSGPSTTTETQTLLRKAFLEISSACGEAADLKLWPDAVASQKNTDLAMIAHMELEEDIDPIDGGDGMFDFYYSPMYWKLRDAFVDQALEGRTDAFLMAIWRAYSAGKVSPDRLEPRTQKERSADNLRTHIRMKEAEATGKAKQAERALALLESTEKRNQDAA